MSVVYRITTGFPEGILLRETIDEEGLQDEAYDAVTNTWVAAEIAADAFFGVEPSKIISEEEAMKIING